MLKSDKEQHQAAAGVTAYIGLGSNLDDPVSHVTRAFADLKKMPSTCSVRHSKLYISTPVGKTGQPDYINAVVAISTKLMPYELLNWLQSIEQAHGRSRTVHWGPRTLDLDILLYGDQQIDTELLTIPHPCLHQRAFVLYPLSEIAPADLLIPGRGLLSNLLLNCPPEGLHPYAPIIN